MAPSCTSTLARAYVIAIAVGCWTLHACARQEEPLNAQLSCYSTFSRTREHTQRAALRLDVREKDWPAFMATVSGFANKTGLELTEISLRRDAIQFHLCTDAGIHLTAWALHSHVGPAWQHTPDDGIRLTVRTTSAD